MIRYAATLLILASPVAATAQSQGAVATAPTKKKSALDPEKVRCIKTPIIGTLSQFTKTCMTNREWDRARAEVQRMRDPSSCPSGQCGG